MDTHPIVIRRTVPYKLNKLFSKANLFRNALIPDKFSEANPSLAAGTSTTGTTVPE